MSSGNWDGLSLALAHSLSLSIGVALLSGFLALPLSWLFCRTNLRGRRFFEKAFTLPYALPGYLLAMAWVTLGNPQVGLLKAFLPRTGIYGPGGILFVETCLALSFPLLELCAGLRRLDPALEEAARMSGASPLSVFLRISAPLLRPAWINGMLLAFLYTLSSFGVPAILGLPVRYPVLTTWIFNQFRLGSASGFQAGFALSLGMILIAGALIALSRFFIRSRHALSGAKSSRGSQVELPAPLNFAFAATFSTALFLILALPWLSLAMTALAPFAGNTHPQDWTLSHVRDLFLMRDFQNGLSHSLTLATVCSTLVVLSGFLLVFTSRNRHASHWSKWARFKSLALTVLFSAPGSAIALLWISLGGALLGGLAFNPWIALPVAYLLKYTALGVRAFSEGFEQISPTLDEAAQLSGARLHERLHRIWMPLLKGSFLAGFTWAFFPIFTELTMSILLTGPGAETLGTVLFQLQEYADQQKAAALAWTLLSFSIGVAVIQSLRKTEEIH